MSVKAGHLFADIPLTSVDERFETLVAVSYTHLDVYKRQVLLNVTL